MKRNKLNILLSTVAVSLAMLQAPLIYYYTFGLFAFFVIIPYMFVGLLLTILLFIRAGKGKYGANMPIVIPIAILVLGIGTLFLESSIESLDWKLRRSCRDEIIAKVKRGEIKPNVSHNNIISTLSGWSFPPISNGGNEIAIYYGENGSVRVEFYINRGFLDHYSAFVYTDDKNGLEELEERIRQDTGNHINEKLDKNWYRVSY